MERDRFILIAILLMVIFFTFMGIIIWQGEHISHDPCGVCAKRMGDEVICTTGGEYGKMITRTFFPNYTIVDGIK